MHIDKRYTTVTILYDKNIKLLNFRMKVGSELRGREFYDKKEAYEWANNKVNELENQGHKITKVIISNQIKIWRC